MVPNESLRAAAREFQVWVNQLKAESDLCMSEILDAAEPAGGEADEGVRMQAAWAEGRIYRRITDVMSAYDSLMESLGETPDFRELMKALQEKNDGTED